MSLRDTAASLDRRTKSVRILTIDVERAPGVGYFWDPWGTNITPEKLIDPPRIISFAAKWLGDKTVIYRDERSGHRAMITTAWELLTEADIVVTYNGDKADIPWLNEHFADYHLGPAAPFKSVDLIKSNRRRFNLTYRRLDYLAGRYIGATKQATDFQLWIDCLDGDDRQWDRMRRYNEADVKLTERLYLQLLPWLVDQPHMGIMSGQPAEWTCPHCGSDKIVRHGKPVTAFVRQYSLYRCQHCGGWLRDQFLRGEPVRTRVAR